MRRDMGGSVREIANAVESLTSSVAGCTAMCVQHVEFVAIMFQAWLLLFLYLFAVDDRAAGESS